MAIQDYHIGVSKVLYSDKVFMGMLQHCRSCQFDAESLKMVVKGCKDSFVDTSGSVLQTLHDPALLLRVILASLTK